MLRRPATQISLTPDDLSDFEGRHNQRLAAATAARQAQMQREREERRRRERQEHDKRKAIHAGPTIREEQERAMQGFKGGREEDMFVTPTTGTSRSDADTTGRAARLANIRDKRRAAAAAASAAAMGAGGGEGLTPAAPSFEAERGPTRDERVMGARTAGNGSFGNDDVFGQMPPGAPARLRR